MKEGLTVSQIPVRRPSKTRRRPRSIPWGKGKETTVFDSNSKKERRGEVGLDFSWHHNSCTILLHHCHATNMEREKLLGRRRTCFERASTPRVASDLEVNCTELTKATWLL